MSLVLAGSKSVTKKRYYIPSTKDDNNIIYVDVFDELEYVLAIFEDSNEIVVDTLFEEEWFIKDVTDDEKIL